MQLSRRTEVVVIESNIAGNGYKAIMFANRMSATSHFITVRPLTYDHQQFNPLKIATETTVLEALDPESLLAFLIGRPPAGIIAPIDFHVFAAAVVSRELGLISPTPSAVLACRRKDITRKLIAGLGHSVRYVKRNTRNINVSELKIWPCIFKPIDQSGGFAVRRCLNGGDVKEAVGQLAKTGPASHLQEFLLEEELVGDEYSAEAAWNCDLNRWEIVTFVKKIVTDGPYCIEIGHLCPFSFGSRELDQQVRATVVRWLDAVKLAYTVAHVEFKMCADIPALIEINPRVAGGRIPDIVRMTTGVDLVELQVAIAVPSLRRRAVGFCGPMVPYAAIAFAMPKKSGTVRSIEWNPREMEGVVDTTIMPGHKAVPSISNDDRAGSAIAFGNTREDAWKRAWNAVNNAVLVYDSLP